mgnify:FL=1|jgi:hypothetical protein|tara:strand:+ start:304 stop:1485 length:1182 start_codon:yes stop_codon:yes gene_type:complete
MGYLHEFGQEDKFVNELQTHPQYSFVMHNGTKYLNNRRYEGQNLTDGTVNLYELNVDRAGGVDKIYPFVYKDATLTGLRSVSRADFHSASYGDLVTGSYPLSASIEREYFTTSVAGLAFSGRKHLVALKNTLDYYTYITPSYDYLNYSASIVSMISVPSIIFGSAIKKGSVDLKFYYTGSLIGRAQDIRKNGELISTMVSGTTSGSVIGTVLYNEGFIVITGSGSVGNLDNTAGATALSSQTDTYVGTVATDNPRWQYFGAYKEGSTYATKSTFSVEFQGTHKIPTLTMFANAKEGELNHSLNPTFISSSHTGSRNYSSASGGGAFLEDATYSLTNTISSSFCSHSADFAKQTYISQVGIYDDERNLLGIAKVARPVRKVEDNAYTFKLKLDL